MKTLQQRTYWTGTRTTNPLADYHRENAEVVQAQNKHRFMGRFPYDIINFINDVRIYFISGRKKMSELTEAEINMCCNLAQMSIKKTSLAIEDVRRFLYEKRIDSRAEIGLKMFYIGGIQHK